MRKYLVLGISALALTAVSARDLAQPIKTRLDHLSGTDYVVVISYLPYEITTITCQSWVMLGVDSWKHQNDFTLPAANPGSATIAIMNSHKFEGYCREPGSIIAHTDSGDFIGTLDRGQGNWKESTKLTISQSSSN